MPSRLSARYEALHDNGEAMASHLPEVGQDFRDRMEDEGVTGVAGDQVPGASARHLTPGGAPATGQLR